MRSFASSQPPRGAPGFIIHLAISCLCEARRGQRLSGPHPGRCCRHEHRLSSFLFPDHFASRHDPRSCPTPAHLPAHYAPSWSSSCGGFLPPPPPPPTPNTGPPPSGAALGSAPVTPHRQLTGKWHRRRLATVERPSPVFLMGWPDSAQVNNGASLFHMDLIESS
jgi:hypothetical protein